MIADIFLAFLIFFLIHVLLIRRNKNRDQYVAFILSGIISISFLVNFAKNNTTENILISVFFLSSCILSVFWFYYTFPTGLSSKLLYMMNKKITNKKIINMYKKKLIASRVSFLKDNKFIIEKNNCFYALWKGEIISKWSTYINFILNKR
jgi:hypothetical protein